MKGKEFLNMEEVLKQFNAVAANEGIAAQLQIIKIEVRTVECISQMELHGAISNFSPLSGWVTTQSANLMLEDWVANPNGSGFILYGEFSKPNHSMHIRQSRKGWSVTNYQEGMGEEVMVEDVSFVSVRSDRELFCYRNYWRNHEGFGFRVFCSRFVGLKKIGGSS